MRYRDLLFENAVVDRVKHEIAKRGFIVAGLEPGEERNPDGLPEDEIIAILIEDAERTLARLGPVVYAFRAISVAELQQLRTHQLGQSWSLEEEMALPYRGDQRHFYRLAGRIRVGDIDRDETILMQVAYEEQEIVVRSGSPIVIDEVMLCTPDREQPIKTAMVGQTFHA